MPRSGSTPPGGRPGSAPPAADDDELRAEVGRLLAQDERADRDGFLTPPEATGRASGSDGELAPPRRSRPPQRAGPIDRAGAAPADDTGGFTPRAAIAPRTRAARRSPSPDRSCGRGCASCR